MKVAVSVESSEVVPPMLAEQIAKGIVKQIEQYGYDVALSLDQQSVVEANMRFMEWMEQQKNRAL